MKSKKKPKAEKRRPNIKLIVTNVLLSLVLVVSSVALTVLYLLDHKLFIQNEVDEPEHATGLEDIVSSTDENVAYFLIVGLDKSKNLSDIIMVACYDLQNNTINILQIPRDTYVGGVPSGKVNAVYGNPKSGESKIKALIRRINKDFGIPIDHYVTTTIEGFRNIVDTVGGIEVDLPKKLNLFNDNPGMETTYTIGPGKVLLDGYKAESFIRHRASYATGDMGRVEAQRLFYSGFAEKMLSLSLSDMMNIAKECFGDVSTDLTTGQMLGYAQKAHGLKTSDMYITAVPGQSGYYAPEGQSYKLSYYSVHISEYLDIINENFRPYEQKVLTKNDIDLTELHSEVTGDEIGSGGSFDKILGKESETTKAS